LPTVLIGSIFYKGHRIVKDSHKRIFDKNAAACANWRRGLNARDNTEQVHIQHNTPHIKKDWTKTQV